MHFVYKTKRKIGARRSRGAGPAAREWRSSRTRFFKNGVFCPGCNAAQVHLCDNATFAIVLKNLEFEEGCVANSRSSRVALFFKNVVLQERGSSRTRFFKNVPFLSASFPFRSPSFSVRPVKLPQGPSGRGHWFGHVLNSLGHLKLGPLVRRTDTPGTFFKN